MKYSLGYYVMSILGIMCSLSAILLVDTNHPQACAVMCVFAFIFFWFPQMLPDHEKYSHTYLGNEKRHRDERGSN